MLTKMKKWYDINVYNLIIWILEEVQQASEVKQSI